MVFVDPSIWPYRNMMMCHMMADTESELHEMADKIGIARRHFQNKPGRVPHYDICKSKRSAAVKLGAKEIGLRECVTIMRRLLSNSLTASTNSA